jgi:flavin-dependent dehydrogenase
MVQNEPDLPRDADVVIVGSGPAGAAAAKTLSDAGVSALIVEKSSLPRYKMCSGILFPRSVQWISEEFGELPDHVFCEPVEIKGNRVALSVDTPLMDAPFRIFDDDPGLADDGRNTYRAELDHWLSMQSGARLLDECTFADLARSDGTITVRLRHRGRSLEVEARYLVGADGTRSKVRRVLNPGFDEALRLVPNYEEFYRGSVDLEPGWLYMFFDRKITGFFATLFHKDDQIVVVTGERQDRSVKATFAEYVKYLQERHGLVIEEKTATHGCSLHDMSATDNYFLGDDNVLLAGEAGGFNRCAEGITSALITGKAAGQSILRSMESGKPALELYTEAAAPEIEACNRVNGLIEQVVGLNPFTRE